MWISRAAPTTRAEARPKAIPSTESAYAILDDREATVEFRRVGYDVGQTQRLMQAADLPPRLAERLAWGR